MTLLLGQWRPVLLVLLILGGQNIVIGQTSMPKQQVLWQRLEAAINDVDRDLDGVLGVAIEDLTSGQKSLLRGNELFPQASSIKIAVLAELYRQAQSGKLKLNDL
jgi:beta-lactamase class A